MRARNVASALLVVGVLAAGTLVPASADDNLDQKQDQLSDQIANTRHDLESASKQLQAAATDLERASAELPGARAAYASVLGKLDGAQERLDLIRQRLRQLRAQRQKVQVEIDQAKVDIAETQTLIARIVRYQYQSGGFAELEVILDAQSPAEFVQSLMATQTVTDSQSAVVDQLTADEAVLAAREQMVQVTEEAIQAAETEAETQVERLQSLAAKAKAAKAKIKSLIAARSEALAVAARERADEKQRLADLKAAQEALDAQIAAQTSSGAGQPTGQLIWPIPGGAMVQGVGWREHPVYHYLSCHTGVDISAGSGTQILAAHSGTVVWTKSELDGPYGNNTLIDHGDGLSTFYAHQSQFAVEVGDHVKTGEVIGYVGETGYATGPHLHFEVHINGVPFDPMGWFGGAKTPQSEFCP
ncbi:MAG: peptidoglycan DD-metalloendopeptidase family protein [Candidatus Nanopelagicales bacterium]